MVKKIIFIFFLAGIFSLSCCNTDAGPEAGTDSQTEIPSSKATPPKEEKNINTPVMLQLTDLTPGEELAVLHTNMGDIKLRFFPAEAPMAVENFITHAKNGYYDGVVFHRAVEDFMIQGGDPTGTGGGGQSIWGGTFGYEFSLNVRHFRGALAMAHSRLPDSNGSQFYIVTNKNLNSSFKTEYEKLLSSQDDVFYEGPDGVSIITKELYPAEMLEEYIHKGGTPFLDLIHNTDGHTVFGHVVEGMDVVDAIAAMETDANELLIEKVFIERISFEIYQP